MTKKYGSFLVWAVALAVVAAGIYLIQFYEKDSGGQRRGGFGGAASVRLTTVENIPFADVIESIGTAKARESVVLTARISETVQSVNFDDGQQVKAGTLIVELTNGEEKAQVTEAEANLREARSQFERITDLVRQGNSSESVLDVRTRELEAAQSRLMAAKARLEDRMITAPFDGVLGIRQVSVGTLVSPGSSITTLDDVSVIKADFSVPEIFLSNLREGQEIDTYAAAYPGEVFKGVVRTIASRVDPATRTVQIRAEIQNQDGRLRPGMLLVVNMESNQRSMPAVPEGSIVPVGDNQFVYVADENMEAKRVQIETGVQIGTMVEVVSGISAGDRVVSSGIIRVRPGIKLNELSQ